jgi:hypothetical protein
MDAAPRPNTVVEISTYEFQRLSSNLLIQPVTLDVSHYTGVEFKVEPQNSGPTIQLSRTLAQ